MKKTLIVFITAVIAVLFTGCAAIQTIEKDDATLLAVKIAAKRVGYAVAQKNPQHTADMIAYAEALANAGDSEKLINEALPQALAMLGGYASDPLLQSDITDLVALIKLKVPDVDVKVRSNLARVAIGGFIEGCKLAQP